jgi:7,8-dihydropterin-6-yl-methyl-4-(beta-D-ribofuranosyl)aminobenzene 5'-phosphate synthase
MDVTSVVDDAVKRSSAFWGEHGAAFLIETDDGRVIFDTGQSGTVLMHNLELLGVDPGTIDAVALSHGHYDHTGGLSVLLEHLRPGTPLYGSPDLFRVRYSVRDGSPERVGIELTQGALEAAMSLRLRTDEQEIIPGVWTTGEITERPEKEGSSSYHRMRLGEKIVQDRYLDDAALALAADGALMVLCGCCHAGLLNTLAHVEMIFEEPIEVIAGGLHLTGTTDEDLDGICQALTGRLTLRRVYPNHCTGEDAFVALTNALGRSAVRPFPAGVTVEI